MMTSLGTKWRIAGEGVVTCSCAWGCLCQFNALPTAGKCLAVMAHEIREPVGVHSIGGLK